MSAQHDACPPQPAPDNPSGIRAPPFFPIKITSKPSAQHRHATPPQHRQADWHASHTSAPKDDLRASAFIAPVVWQQHTAGRPAGQPATNSNGWAWAVAVAPTHSCRPRTRHPRSPPSTSTAPEVCAHGIGSQARTRTQQMEHPGPRAERLVRVVIRSLAKGLSSVGVILSPL
jgi:hypothetical protein